jgi:hypothetical protein
MFSDSMPSQPIPVHTWLFLLVTTCLVMQCGHAAPLNSRLPVLQDPDRIQQKRGDLVEDETPPQLYQSAPYYRRVKDMGVLGGPMSTAERNSLEKQLQDYLYIDNSVPSIRNTDRFSNTLRKKRYDGFQSNIFNRHDLSQLRHIFKPKNPEEESPMEKYAALPQGFLDSFFFTLK